MAMVEISFRASDNRLWLVTHLRMKAAYPPLWAATAFRVAEPVVASDGHLVEPNSTVEGNGKDIVEAVLEARKAADAVAKAERQLDGKAL